MNRVWVAISNFVLILVLAGALIYQTQKISILKEELDVVEGLAQAAIDVGAQTKTELTQCQMEREQLNDGDGQGAKRLPEQHSTPSPHPAFNGVNAANAAN